MAAGSGCDFGVTVWFRRRVIYYPPASWLVFQAGAGDDRAEESLVSRTTYMHAPLKSANSLSVPLKICHEILIPTWSIERIIIVPHKIYHTLTGANKALLKSANSLSVPLKICHEIIILKESQLSYTKSIIFLQEQIKLYWSLQRVCSSHSKYVMKF